MDWVAQWLWASGEASPRNAWRCFRKTFAVAEIGWDSARLSITADSRYVLYLNGERLGRGPARSWPFEQSYDSYEVAHLLKPGEMNVLAVLVLHYGVSTFQYLRGRGGLLAQLELTNGEETVATVATNSSWKTTSHTGHDSRSPRMSVQLGFAERVDARQWDDDWLVQDFDDGGWAGAKVVGPVGTEPWTTLKPRDIPHLTEEPRYPNRVVSLRAVKPVVHTAALDLCLQMMPDSANHSNAVRYAGYLATLLRLDEPTRVTLGSPLATVSVFGACYVNGVLCDPTSFTGSDPERYVTLELEAGEHLFLIETTGDDRSGVGLHLGLDANKAFTLVSPLGKNAPTPFVTLGPFDEMVVIDHEPSRGLELGVVYQQVKAVKTRDELLVFGDWLRPVSEALVSRDDVFTACVWTREGVQHSVPAALQNSVTASSELGIVPVFDNMDSEFILDFGVETSGFLEFEVDAAAGTVLDFYGFEYLQGDWRQDTHLLDNTLRYTCREGRQRYVSVVRRGLRYLIVVIRNAARPVKFIDVHLLESTYPTPEVGKFSCSDPLLNDIWAISRRTLKLCMEDTYVDCPAYEQTFWVGDARNAALINHYIFGADTLTARCLRLVPPSKIYTPLYADQVPSGWNSVISNWTFFWVIACLEHVERTGDVAFARELWPHVQSTLEAYLQKLDERGLLYTYGWNLLDWAPIDQPRDGVVAHQTMFLVKALRSAEVLAQFAGADGSAFNLVADDLKGAINQHLWSEERKAYRDAIHTDGTPSQVFSMQTQVVAYLCDVAAGARKVRIERYLEQPPEDFVQIGSPFMSFFYYEALVKLGRFELLLEDIRRNYGGMLKHDATTCWEMYPGKENRASPNLLTRSHCHAWSAAPGYFLGAFVLGVRPAKPGWTKIILEPHTCGLEWVRGSVPLPGLGRIDVDWYRNPIGHLELEVTLPVGIELEVRVAEGRFSIKTTTLSP